MAFLEIFLLTKNDCFLQRLDPIFACPHGIHSSVIEFVPLPHFLHGVGDVVPFLSAYACLPQYSFFVECLQYSFVPFTNHLHGILLSFWFVLYLLYIFIYIKFLIETLYFPFARIFSLWSIIVKSNQM